MNISELVVDRWLVPRSVDNPEVKSEVCSDITFPQWYSYRAVAITLLYIFDELMIISTNSKP